MKESFEEIVNILEIISKIDANLKLYYDMQKQLLKNKINNL